MAELDVADPQQMSLEPSIDPALEPTPETPEMIALRAELVEAQQRESDANSQRDAVNERFDQYLSRPAPQEAAPAQRVDPMGAPDPAVDPEGFSRHNAALHAQSNSDFDRRLTESSTRLEQKNQAALDKIRSDQAAANKWSEFRGAYPELAHREDLAQYAFGKVYPDGMPQDASGVVHAVKAKMDEIIGTPTPAVNRTGGVGGGSAPPRPPAPKTDEQAPKSMVDMMLDAQLEQGII